jgi:hypothetical protein
VRKVESVILSAAIEDSGSCRKGSQLQSLQARAFELERAWEVPEIGRNASNEVFFVLLSTEN